jgi:mannonate dehydratase
MSGGDLYSNLDQFSKAGNIAYVHARNVKGKVPRYQEVFIDEGDIDMHDVLNILHRNEFDGVIIPDHTPEMSCSAPWHAGMAYAMGYLRATLESVTGKRL